MVSKRKVEFVASLCALMFLIGSVFAPLAQAQSAVESDQAPVTAPVTPPTSGHELDLSSTQATTSASFLSSAVTIDLGGTQKVVQPTDFLTAAEHLAVLQAVQGQQTILLGLDGSAIGGSVNLTSQLSGQLSNVVVPQGVTAFHDFGTTSVLKVLGNFTNSGNFYAVSSIPTIDTAVINAGNIFNQTGALLTTALPTGFLGGTNYFSSLSLTLNAVQQIVNAGTISSAGNLTLTAGDSIINSVSQTVSNVTASMANIATMSAANSLNLQAMNIVNSGILTAHTADVNTLTANLTNNGLIQSVLGNVAVQNLRPDLGLNVMNGPNGVIQALNGTGSFSFVQDTLKQHMDVVGGSLFAENLAFNTGDGHLSVNVKDISGAVDVHTGTAAFSVTDGTHGLNIRSFEITGDPDLVYTGVGPFVSAGFNSLGGIVNINTFADTTNGSITFTGDINTTPSVTGKGGNVTLNAGTSVNTRNIITSGNGTGNGGNINIAAFTSVNTLNLTTSGGATAGNAGSIVIDSPFITTVSVGNITATGGNVGDGGDVYLRGSTSVSGGAVNTSGGAAGGSAGSIAVNSPYLGGAVTLGNITATGSVPSASFKGLTALSRTTFTAGTVRINGAVNVYTVGSQQYTGIDTSSTFSDGGAVSLTTDGGGITIGAGGINTTSSVSGDASGDIELYAPTGAVTVGGNLNASASGGATAGSISALSGGAFNQTAGTVNTSSTSTLGDAGQVNILSGGNLTAGAITANGATTNGSGGNVNLFAGTGGTGTLNASSISTLGRGSTGQGGNVMLVAPGALTAGAITTTGALAPSGSVYAIAGNTGTVNSAAQTGTLTVGAIDTSTSSTLGGNVVLVNMGSNGAVSASNITASSLISDGTAGSIAVSAGGAITVGNIAADAVGSSATGTATAGTLLLSSGATTGVAVRTGTISLDGDGAGGKTGGNLYIIRNAGTTSVTGSISQKGAPKGNTFNGTPTAQVPNISTGATLTFDGGNSVSGYVPGGFTSITGGTITVNGLLGNGDTDTRLLVPIVTSGGNVTVGGISILTAGLPSQTALIAAGNVTMTGAVTANSTAGRGGNFSAISSTGTVTTSSINASGTTSGGQIFLAGARGVDVSNGSSLLANSVGNVGVGGRVDFLSGNGMINLGSSLNLTGGTVNASGTSGGNIRLIAGGAIENFETSLIATGTSQAGGNVRLQSLFGWVNLFNAGTVNSDINVSSTALNGGSIYIAGPLAVNVLGENGCCAVPSGTFNADGFHNGGSIAITSSVWAIDVSNLSLISARATDSVGMGGTVKMSTAGQLQTRTIDVSGPNGGTIQMSGFFYNLEDGGRLLANSSATGVQIGGSGGLVRLVFPFEIMLGRPGNAGGQAISVDGTTSGGVIDLSTQLYIQSYSTSLSANATTGTAGMINVTSTSGTIELFQGTSAGNISASSTGGAGGAIHLTAAAGISSLSDSGSSTYSIAANGTTAGGSVIVANTSTGDISLAQLSGISANATAGIGGRIALASFAGNTSVLAPLTANGSAGGGSVAAVSSGTLTLSNITANATTSGRGGTIYLSSVGNMIAGNLTANGVGNVGGRVIGITAQPISTATGTTLSQSGAAAIPFASGTINVGTISVTGSSAGASALYTSGGATITGGVGATKSTVKTVLPKNFSVTTNYTLALDTIPGGSFSSFSNTATLTLSGFPTNGPAPLVMTTSSVALGNVTASNQSFLTLSGGAASLGTINTSNAAASGGNVAIFTLSSASNTISASGNITTTGGGVGNSAGYVLLDAPFGSFSSVANMQINAGINASAVAAPITLLFGNNVTMSGTAVLNGSALRVVSTDGAVSLTLNGMTGALSGRSGGDFSAVVNAGALTVSDVVARAGALTIRGGTTATTLTVSANRSLIANEGNVTIQNDNITTGTIVIGANTTITGLSKQSPALGNVRITLGAPPASPVAGITPVNVTVTTSNGGGAFFGTNGITAAAPTNRVNAIGSNVVFNTGARAAAAISLGGGNIITADPPGANVAAGSTMVQFGSGYLDGTDTTPNAALTDPTSDSVVSVIDTAVAQIAGVFQNNENSVPFLLAINNPKELQAISSNVPAFRSSTITPVDSLSVGFGLPSNPEAAVSEDTAAGSPSSTDDEVRKRKNQELNQGSNFKPIAFVTPATGATSKTNWIESDDFSLWSGKGTLSPIADGAYRFDQGAVLVATKRAIQIETAHGNVNVGRDVLLTMHMQNGALVMRNLHESKQNQVAFSCDGQTVLLHVGTSVILGQDDDLSATHEAKHVPIRSVHYHKLPNQHSARVGEFSFTSVMAADEDLNRALTARPALKQTVLKTFAAFSVATSGHGVYAHERR